MTYREKLMKEHPNSVNDSFVGGCECCPRDWGYCNAKDDLCGEQRTKNKKHSNLKCAKCWDRTIPGTEKKIKKLPPDEKKTTWKATYAEFTDGHREEIFYCSGMDNSIPIEFATESGMYVYYENPNNEKYELHHPTKPRLTVKDGRPCFHKVQTYLNYGELRVMTTTCYDIDHIEFEEVEAE